LEPDPTIIPSTSALGFLGRLPFKLGGTLRYKPSAADLQEHPGGSRNEYRDEEGEPLIGDNESEDEGDKGKGHKRQRSSTTSSGETSDSFRSRGDLFPSDGEDDAVPLSDEFAMALERRATLTGTDDRSSGKTKSSKGKRPAGSRTLSRTMSHTTQSSQSRPRLDGHRASSGASIPQTPDLASPDMIEAPSLTDLQQEEERIRMEEEEEVDRKRQAAAILAAARGLHVEEPAEEAVSETKLDPTVVDDIPEPADEHGETSEDVPVPSNIEVAEAEEAPKELPRDSFVPARLPNFG
jgi:hypothetical protein